MQNGLRHRCRWQVAAGMLLLMLAGGCSNDEQAMTPAGEDGQPVAFAVSEQPWRGEQQGVTRSGETLTALQTTPYFGLYCEMFSFVNRQVTWSAESESWSFANKTLLWPKDVSSFAAYAYAPYLDIAGGASYADGSQITAFAAPNVTFVPVLDNQTDLLWAHGVRDGRKVNLDFRHSLAKVSFGTVKNNFGRTITVTGITVTDKSGDRLYQSGKLSLADGTWSDQTRYDAEQTISRPVTPNLVIDNEQTGALSLNPVLQIPGPTVTVTLTFTYTDDDSSTSTETAVGDVVLVKGTDKTLNFTIGRNHEVLIIP